MHVSAELFSNFTMNPIENVFSVAKRILNDEAIEKNCCCKSIEEYHERILNILHGIPVQKIDIIISSMNHRIQLIVKSKGKIIQY